MNADDERRTLQERLHVLDDENRRLREQLERLSTPPMRPASEVGNMGISWSTGGETQSLLECALQLDDARAFAENLLDTLPDPILVLDTALCVERANRTYYRYFHVTPEEIVSKCIDEIGHGHWDDPRLKTLLEEVLPHHASFLDYEVARNFPGLGYRVIHLSAQRVEQQRMRSPLILLVLKDITELVQNRALIQASEERLAQLISHCPDLVYFQDCDLRYTWVPKTIPPLPRETLIGKTDAEIFPDEEAQRLTQLKLRAFESEKEVREEVMLRVAGAPRYFDAAFVPWRDPSGTISGITGFLRDITDRKLAALAIEEERTLLATVIELMPFPLFIVAPDGRVLRANVASREQLNGMTFHELLQAPLLHPVTRTPITAHEHPFRQAMHGIAIPVQEWLLILPDGTELPVVLYFGAVRLQDELAAVVVAMQDILELKAIDRAKDELLSYLSHELLTPLTSIMGYAQMAMKDTDPETLRAHLAILWRNALRQKRMMKDLLDVSRIVYGRLQLSKYPGDLWELAQEAIADIRAEMQAQVVQLRLNPPAEPLPIEADLERILQIIEHLLENAIKATEADGSVTISAYREGDKATISVQDTGKGIAPEMLEKLFQPFSQVARGPGTEGIGLGLALVKGLIELHGGQITVTSAGIGQGSTFSFSLPLAGMVKS